MINVISLGAGKQSTYMLLNALENQYSHYPDFAIFSDTGCEPKYVYEYLEWLIKYVKDKYNFDIFIVSSGNLKKDIERYIDGELNRVSQIPLMVKSGVLRRGCTMDYKIRPLRQYLQKVRNKQIVNLWIGISLDEIERIKYSTVKYITHYYPLIEKRIGIDTIKKWFTDTGTPEPMKSACLICPFHSKSYWQVFKKNFPDEFKEACEFDNKIRIYPKINEVAYLWRGLTPLEYTDFTQENSLFPELIEECYGLCGL
jgi:hypothetical protein